MSRASHRAEFTDGYVLHQRPYRDTSLIIELYTREHGRLSAFARAARGPRSRFRGLQPFRPLLLSWVGRGEAPTLTGAEGDGPAPRALAADRLLSGFYLNELLLKLTVAHDPQPELYAHYDATLERLRAGEPLDALLRRFEKRLLDLLGYGSELSCETSGRAVRADAYYHFHAGTGLSPTAADADAVQGQVLLALAADEPLHDPDAQRQARMLLRAALDHCLEGRELNVRAVARAVASMERAG